MSSIYPNKKTGFWELQFTYNDKKHTIRTKLTSKRNMEQFQRHYDDMLRCRISGSVFENSTAEWLANLPDNIRRKFERLELVASRERREVPNLGDWLSEYINKRKDVEQGTILTYHKTENNLNEFFSPNKRLDEITKLDAKQFIQNLRMQKKAEDTVNRRGRMACQFFKAAVEAEIIKKNPFSGMKLGNINNETRQRFIEEDIINRILEFCPSAEWRLIVVLCRWGGLRCPTEVIGLQWKDIDWNKGRMIIHSPKTKKSKTKGIRTVPLWPQIMPHLREVFEQALPNTEYVINVSRDPRRNLRTPFSKILRKAGIELWPRLFQNLRATRQTELSWDYPAHMVCRWMGNSVKVANDHYFMVTEDYNQKALENERRKMRQQIAERDCKDMHQENDDLQKSINCSILHNAAVQCVSQKSNSLGRDGFEPS